MEHERRFSAPAVLVIVIGFALTACGRSAVPHPTLTADPPVTATPSTSSPRVTDGTAEGALGSRPIGDTEIATVVRVVDGDTIVVDRGRGEERVRYIGIDTPEAVDPRSAVEWLGREASAANEALVGGRDVVLERDLTELDDFGRLLRYVWTRVGDSWTFVNLELVRRGFAQVVTYPPDIRYVELYLAAQSSARGTAVGLWGEPPIIEAPPSDAARDGCEPAYPTVCIPPSPPDLDCPDVTFRRFEVLPPDPHRFDGGGDGIGCEAD